MKTYLINLSSRLHNFAKKRNVEKILCNKAWVVLRDDGVKETYIFNNDNIIISRDGKASMGTFKVLIENKILISMDSEIYLINPLFSDTTDLVALQLDGKNEYSFLINESCELYQHIRTYTSLERYIDEQEKLIQAEEKQRNEAQEQRYMKFHKDKYLAELELYYLKYNYRYKFILKFLLVLFIVCIDIIIEMLLYNNGFIWGYISWLCIPLCALYLYNNYREYLIKSAIQQIDELLYKLPLGDIKRTWLNEHRDAINQDWYKLFPPNY